MWCRWTGDGALYRPHVVFHAAAYKHVPDGDDNAWQAGCATTMLGTWQVARSAIVRRVPRFVLRTAGRSPTNGSRGHQASGQARLPGAGPAGQTQFEIVRFGSIAVSAGSVIPSSRSRSPVALMTVTREIHVSSCIPSRRRRSCCRRGRWGRGEIFVMDMGERYASIS